MIEFKFAKIEDVDKIMCFIDKFWKKNHLLSKSKELFLYDFLEDNKVNIGLALNKDEIIGIFGFIKYNYEEIPDIAGSLWKIRNDYNIPLLGIKLRKFVLSNVKHRFFAAPGANLDTKPIYDILGEIFYKMNQWYIINNKINNYKIIKFKNNISFNYKISTCNKKIKKISKKDLEFFNFDKNIYPFKDKQYIIKRFFDYPFYEYDIYGVFNGNKEYEIETIFICRKVEANERSAYRIVDFYGKCENIKEIGIFLYNYIIKNKLEYVDFLEYGIDNKFFANSLFKKRIDNSIIIPQYFEPFIQQNKDIYGVAYKGVKFKQFKADGDQDRPNILKGYKN